MKRIKYLLFFLLLFFAKFSNAQTLTNSLSVYPNPICQVATIHFTISSNDTVTLKAYNIVGQCIKTYFTNTILPAGSYSIDLLAYDLNPGIYIISFQYGFDSKKNYKFIKQCDAINTVTSINNEKIIFYPNPTDNLLAIAIVGNINIVVTNLQGQIMKELKTDEGLISLRDLSSGIYIVSVYDNDRKLIATRKVVVAPK